MSPFLFLKKFIPNTIPNKSDKNQGKKRYFRAKKNPDSRNRKPGFLVFRYAFFYILIIRYHNYLRPLSDSRYIAVSVFAS